MARATFTAILITALAAIANTVGAQAQSVRVHLRTDYTRDGFKDADTQRLQDSAVDVGKIIDKNKWLVRVDAPSDADVVLELQSSATEATGRTQRSSDIFDVPGTRQAETATTVRVRVSVGDHVQVFEGSSKIMIGAWKEAAKEATRKALVWISENRSQILNRK